MTGPRIGSLCSGFGGLDLGVESVVGGSVAWFCEYDRDPSAILAHHWPDVPNLGDVTATNWLEVEPVDVLTAGFPCQPFSHAGSRLGERDPRHLWPYIAQAIAVLRPSLVVLENVAGLISIGDTFDEPNDRCVCGWPVRWRGVDRPGADRAGLVDRLSHGDDSEGEDGPRRDGRRVRRAGQAASSGHGEVGGGVDVVTPRVGGGGVLAAHSAVAATEAGDRRGGAKGGGRPRGAGAVRSGVDSETVDPRGVGAMLNDSQGSEAAEQAWAFISAGEAADCPACGRAVDGDAVRSVYRHGMGSVLGPLARLGYDATWGVVRAADAGAPHGRARIFIVATPDADEVGRARSRRARHGRTGPADHAGTDAHASRDGRDEGWAEPTGLVGGSDAPECRRATPADAAGATVRGPQPDSVDAAQWGTAELGERDSARPWGPYEAAIRRWEAVTGRPAPAPTEPGRTGHRLAPAFVEWMMGLPPGHVTDVPGLSRNAQLKALGNGVVPQQAALALSLLLPRAVDGAA